MKSTGIFCASPASTAICSNTDSRSVLPQDLRRIDHKTRKGEAPCLPLDPIAPFYTRKSTSSSSSFSSKKNDKSIRRKSSADAADVSSSSRYLLSEKPKPFLDFIPESGRAIVSTRHRRDNDLCNNNIIINKYKRLNSDGFTPFSTESQVFKPSLTSSNAASLPVTSNHQVVELRVSIHCKGCEGKLRKHISKMEGVTSFNIDLPTKKVTVIGDVTPLGVLASISKVKNAQLWTSPSPQTPRVALTSSVFR